FTTNYDLCLDNFLADYRYEDGFKESRGYRVFAGTWSSSQSTYKLGKLHGSISWFRFRDQVVQFLPPIPDPLSYGDTAPFERILIYPAGDKDMTRSPYAECLSYFRKRL